MKIMNRYFFKSTYWFVYSTIIISLLVCIASLNGIFNSITYIQESSNWTVQAIGQDIGNLIATPILLVSVYFIVKKRMNAYLIWLGTLLYFMYAYTIYAFFIHFNFLFLVYVGILGLSTYTFLASVIKKFLNLKYEINDHNMKFPSLVLIIIGGLFYMLWLAEIVPALLANNMPASAKTAGLWVNPVQVIDLSLVLPGIILTGILLWQRKTLGYFFAAPWLMFSVLMGTSIVAAMVLELNNGNTEAIMPLTMVGIIVIASVVSLWNFLKKFRLNLSL